MSSQEIPPFHAAFVNALQENKDTASLKIGVIRLKNGEHKVRVYDASQSSHTAKIEKKGGGFFGAIIPRIKSLFQNEEKILSPEDTKKVLQKLMMRLQGKTSEADLIADTLFQQISKSVEGEVQSLSNRMAKTLQQHGQVDENLHEKMSKYKDNLLKNVQGAVSTAIEDQFVTLETTLQKAKTGPDTAAEKVYENHSSLVSSFTSKISDEVARSLAFDVSRSLKTTSIIDENGKTLSLQLSTRKTAEDEVKAYHKHVMDVFNHIGISEKFLHKLQSLQDSPPIPQTTSEYDNKLQDLLVADFPNDSKLTSFALCFHQSLDAPMNEIVANAGVEHEVIPTFKKDVYLQRGSDGTVKMAVAYKAEFKALDSEGEMKEIGTSALLERRMSLSKDGELTSVQTKAIELRDKSAGRLSSGQLQSIADGLKGFNTIWTKPVSSA